jgi:hypothetical protein
MAEDVKLVLSDRDVPPTDEIIFSHIGKKKDLWQSIMAVVSAHYNDMAGTWNYYNDGKQWLFKMVQKKKTIFWIGVLEGSFRVTFYFGGKAEALIVASDLPEREKQQYLTGTRYGNIRAVTINVNEKQDISTIEKLIEIKTRLK